MEIFKRLQARKEARGPIRIGIIGCGQMGSGLAHTIGQIDGMSVRILADIAPQRAVDTFHSLGVDHNRVVVTDSEATASEAIREERCVVTGDASLPARVEGVEAIVEATGVPDVGARVAWGSIEQRVPIIMLNVETDVTIGVLLNRTAREAGSVYTVASGDEPGVCRMLYDQARLMGFEVVCLGKGKNNPIDITMSYERCTEEAARKGMNPKMLASFIDGTKTMVEMAAVSNATGLLPDVAGMHGPKVDVDQLVSTFIPKQDGGIFERRGTVDYSTGRVAPGVFAIVYTEDPRMRTDMEFITGAKGPYYLHFRPYHLADIETPISVAEAVLFQEPTVTAEAMNAEVVAVAKRFLKAGQRISGIGGPDVYGRIYTYAEASAGNMLPIGIATGGTMLQDVPANLPLTRENATPDTSTFVYELRQRQDELLAREQAVQSPVGTEG